MISKKDLQLNSQKAKKVMDFMIRNCCKCAIGSNKRRLFKTMNGEMCQMCFPEGTTVAQCVNAEHEYLEFLKAEAAKPPPEGHGSWS